MTDQPSPPSPDRPGPSGDDARPAPAGDPAGVDPWAEGGATSADEELAAAEQQVRAARDRDVRAGLDRLTGEVATLRARHADLAAAVSEQLGPTLAALEQTTTSELGQLRGHIKELYTAVDQEQQAKNPPVDWIGMNAETAREQWPILARWVGEVLVGWYEITRDQLPDCWPLHTPAVIELSWVRSAHRQAYLAHVHPHITGEWHTRWLPHLLTRLGQLIDSRKCRSGEHRPERGEPMIVEQPQPRAGEPAPLPRTQLATPQHWWPFYAAAYRADLARRTAREAQDQHSWTPADPTSG